MANTIVNVHFKARNSGAATPVDLNSDTIKVALVNATYTALTDAQKQAQQFYSDIGANEVTGTNWPAGGVTLANVTITPDEATGKCTIDADDVTVASATIAGATGAVLYKDTGTGTTSPIIGYADFGKTLNATDGPLTLAWAANGIFDW